MLQLLLDEHIAPKIAEQLKMKHPKLMIHTVAKWEGGQHLGSSDTDLLRYAYAQHITLVTYDLRTIAPLLKIWTEQQISHGGVIFVDTRTYRPNDFGGLVNALESLWVSQKDQDWLNKVVFLQR